MMNDLIFSEKNGIISSTNLWHHFGRLCKCAHLWHPFCAPIRHPMVGLQIGYAQHAKPGLIFSNFDAIYSFLSNTQIFQTLQTVYSVICFFCTLFDWNEEIAHKAEYKSKHHVPSYWRRTRLHKACDFMYSTSVFPVGMASCLMFWFVQYF